jgi:hypothetical protein
MDKEVKTKDCFGPFKYRFSSLCKLSQEYIEHYDKAESTHEWNEEMTRILSGIKDAVVIL